MGLTGITKGTSSSFLIVIATFASLSLALVWALFQLPFTTDPFGQTSGVHEATLSVPQRSLLQAAPPTTFPTFPNPPAPVALDYFVYVPGNESINGRNRKYNLETNSTRVRTVVEVADGGTVNNFTFNTANNPGIICMGSCTLNNVWIEGIGANAAIRLSRSAPAGSNVTINGGGIRNAEGRAISIDAPANVKISNFFWDGFKVAVFVCQRCKTVRGPINVSVSNSFAKFGANSVAFARAVEAAGGVNKVDIMGLAVDNAQATRCTGPAGFCGAQDVRVLNGTTTTPPPPTAPLTPPTPPAAPLTPPAGNATNTTATPPAPTPTPPANATTPTPPANTTTPAEAPAPTAVTPAPAQAPTPSATPTPAGQPTSDFPAPSGDRELDASLNVEANQVIDFQNVRLDFVRNSQDPIIRIREGGQVKNAIIGPGAADGIKCSGSCRLENIWFEDIGPGNAFTVVGSAEKGSVVDIVGGGIKGASTATLMQVNSAVTVNFKNFYFEGFKYGISVCERCKSQPGPSTVNMENCRVQFVDGAKAFYRVNRKGTDNVFNANGVTYNAGGGQNVLCNDDEATCNVEGAVAAR